MPTGITPSLEVKQNAVKAASAKDADLEKIAADIGVGRGTLQRWICLDKAGKLKVNPGHSHGTKETSASNATKAKKKKNNTDPKTGKRKYTKRTSFATPIDRAIIHATAAKNHVFAQIRNNEINDVDDALLEVLHVYNELRKHRQ